MFRFIYWLLSPRARQSQQLFRQAVAKEEPGRKLFGDAIDKTSEEKDEAVNALVKHINSGGFRMIAVTPYNYISTCGSVTVCRDIYGAEMHVLGGLRMLDTHPSYYNLTHAQAKLIYDAVCVHVYNRTIQDD